MSSRIGYTRRHWLHFSPCPLSVRLTGALQTGQTRIFRSSGLTAIAERILTQKQEARASWDFGLRISDFREPAVAGTFLNPKSVIRNLLLASGSWLRSSVLDCPCHPLETGQAGPQQLWVPSGTFMTKKRYFFSFILALFF